MPPVVSPVQFRISLIEMSIVPFSNINFSVFSRNATEVILDIFEDENSSKPYFSYKFDKVHNRTGDVWHVFIEGLKPGALYLYRVAGPFDPEKGHRFNKNCYLIDPYAKALTNKSIFKKTMKSSFNTWTFALFAFFSCS